MKRILFFAAGLMLFGLMSCTENTIEPDLFGSITGVVRTSVGNQPIEGASITTSPPTSAIVTNANGQFSIPEASVGNYTITVKKTGYKTGSVTVSVSENAATSATVLLETDDGSNTPPTAPSDPFPSNESADQPTSLILKWRSVDLNSDSLTYDVFLYESNSTAQIKIAEDYSDTSLAVPDLKFNTTYFWQVIAKDSQYSVNGNVWTFKTKSFPNNRIVYASNIEGNYDIFSTDGTEDNTIKLTNGFDREWWPRLSPDRNKIAFTSNSSIEPQLHIMNKDGSGITLLTNIPVTGNHNYGIGFCWSPDGSQLLFSNYNKIYRIDASGANLTLITQAPADKHFREVEWSPVGNKISALAVGNNFYESEIYLMNSDGSGMELFFGNLPGGMQSPVFSIDGNSLMFTRDVSGFENQNNRQLNSQILIVRLDKSDTLSVSLNKPDGTNDFYPRFSPDGSKIIFTNASNDGTGSREIWVMNIDGTDRQKLIPNGEMPDWK